MIRKRGKTYTVQVAYYETDKATGKQKRHYASKSGFKTKAEAKIYEEKLNLQKHQGKLSNYNPLFTDYFVDWINTYKKHGKAANTVKRYHYCEKIVSDYFKGVKLKSINRNMYQKFLNHYGKDRSKNTVNKTVKLISSSLKDAFDDQIISKNPTLHTQLVYDPDKTRKVTYLSETELKKLVTAVRSSLNPQYVDRYIILTAIYTGARVGELFGLAWSDIDFKNKTIHIQHSWDYMHKHLKDTKNKSSNRVITAPDSLLDVLKQLRHNDSKFVFVRPNRIPANANINNDERLTIGLTSPDSVNKRLRYCLKQAKINKKLHVHSLRHVHVAYLYAHDVDWYTISKRLGHASVKTTMDTYAYLIQEKQAQSEQLIDKLVDDLA